jgi:hypothetical protein
VAAAKRIVTSSGAPATLSDDQLRLKCRQLHTVESEQALSFLISALWAIEDGAEHGRHVSEVEITRSLNELRVAQYPNPAQAQRPDGGLQRRGNRRAGGKLGLCGCWRWCHRFRSWSFLSDPPAGEIQPGALPTGAAKRRSPAIPGICAAA